MTKIETTDDLREHLTDEALELMDYFDDLRALCDDDEEMSVLGAMEEEDGGLYVTVPITVGPFTLWTEKVYIHDALVLAILYGSFWEKEEQWEDNEDE